MMYKTLFSPMNIGQVQIKNRIVMAPMLVGFASLNGTPTQQLLDYYEERAKGGVGLVITEITRVEDFNGATAFFQLALSKDEHIEPMKELVDRVHAHGAKIFIQLHHPGRQNLGLLVGMVPLCVFLDKIIPSFQKLLYKIVPAGKILLKYHLVPRVLAPSKCERSYFSDGINRAMRKSEINALIEKFAKAAERAKKAGADGVELHAAHGYLLQQFLSPNTNKRNDEYGGTLEKRAEFLTRIIKKVRIKCGAKFPIIVRLSVDECYDRIGEPGKGYSLDEGIKIAKLIEEAGADAIDVSSAAYDTYNYWLEPTSFECGWRAYMAEAVKKEVNIPVIAANLIRSAEQAEKQLADDIQDFVSLGRPTIADPHWVNKVEQGNEADIKRCINCLYCIESMHDNAFTGTYGRCSVNPGLGMEKSDLVCNGNKRVVVIAGAGPAGLTAAEVMAKRGFDTVVLEQSDRVGGQVMLAENIPHKEKILWCIEDLAHSAEKAGARIVLNKKAQADIIAEYSPYAVIIATGGQAIKPKTIPGVGLPEVCTVTDVLNGSLELKNKNIVVVGSGMTGLETAELLATQGNNVTVIEMAKTVAPGTWMQHRDDIMPRLKDLGVEILTGQKLVAIHRSFIAVESTGLKKTKSTLQCDKVVLSLGVYSENSLYKELEQEFENLYLIGDACKTGRIAHATESAYNIAINIE
ncbi:MAG: FAD-dependent oxidoreductase [Acutalibacteraceae bacterium]|jgi:2,4-dienoyl-CoA reductase-like NADH-dependent reductase (Old Yellow Enzyme family)/thioredoxin reductase